MKINRFIITILLISAILLSACGKKRDNAKTETVTPQTVLSPSLEQEEKEEETPKIITYKVVLKNNKLSLYEINGENRQLITSMEINPEFYPPEDIAELKEGIEAYCKEDGYEILENFAN